MFETLHMEVKRTCDSRNVDKNTTQFVKFYSNYCKSPHRQEEGENHPILFVFNGADNVEVWNQIFTKARGNTICGHPIYSVWVNAGELSRWELGMINEKLVQEKIEFLEKTELEKKKLLEKVDAAEELLAKAEQEKQELLALIDALNKKQNS
jgi:hypothetical protein